LGGKGVTGKTSLVGALAALARHFGLPVLVLVNQADLHWQTAQAISPFCAEKDYGFLGFLPFDADFTRAQVEGKTIIEYNNKKLQALLQEVWERLQSGIAGRKLKGDLSRPAQIGGGSMPAARLISPPRPKSS
jgi:CO dehydrogenase nickel-insertion accessory protein CooC1